MVNELNDMEKLAIKGHPTRGKEVIEILEMLGGKNTTNLHGECGNMIYIINSSYYGEIIYMIYRTDGYVVFTLEEFIEKYPYKVGDKVQHKDATSCGSVFEIEKMRWVNNDVEYIVKRLWYNNCHTTFTSKDLQPYKEEIVDTGCCSMPTTPPSYKLSVKQLKEMKQTIVFSNDSPDEIELVLGDNYEVKVKEGKTYVVKKQPKYPKTYEECCKVLDWNPLDYDRTGYKFNLLCKLQVLLLCRDAYWKMACDWKPNFNDNEGKFVIAYCYGKVYTTMTTNYNRILVFPTEEMRDAFYENFKELIEECKELL